jgi:hypothetical protein
MRLAAGDYLTMDLPGADWSAIERDGCTAFVRDVDLGVGEGKPEWAPFAIFVSITPADPASRDLVAEDQMERRVPQGYPETFSTSVGGEPALGYEYTDGISLLRTVFVRCPAGGIVELSVRGRFLESGETFAPIPWKRDELLRHVAWSTPWKVWRQDDNGIKAPVSDCVSEQQAQALVREFEARGHKQLYWIEGPTKRSSRVLSEP